MFVTFAILIGFSTNSFLQERLVDFGNQVPKSKIQEPTLQQDSNKKRLGNKPSRLAVPRLPQVNQDAIKEIKQIRDRIGIQLFKDGKSEQEFEKQLQKLTPDTPPNLVPRVQIPSVVSPSEPILLPPRVETPRIATQPATNLSHPKLSSSTAVALFAAIENLDRDALLLEKAGQFEKSKKLRKLSRQIQKQVRDLVIPRDN